ncbi:hypothetical protein BD626DRAFT_499457 [Schizophyllum amplum]|uniref:Uncharacterized protein n=1 Tax=Schizophyllum amplum TaxID=97359 RepID=A0A550CB15_9AGAR|nr:hypothetical protein BD626DRAFT_499457 [Auriculariopsis ampla]
MSTSHTLIGMANGKGKYEPVNHEDRDVVWDSGATLNSWNPTHASVGSGSTDGGIPPPPPPKHRPPSLDLTPATPRPHSAEQQYDSPGLGEFGELASPTHAPLLASTPEETRARLRKAYFNPPDRSSMFDSDQPARTTPVSEAGPYPLLDTAHTRGASASSSLTAAQRDSIYSRRGVSPQPPSAVFAGARPRSASRPRHVKQETSGSRASFFPYQQEEPWAAAVGSGDEDGGDSEVGVRDYGQRAPPSPEERRGRHGLTPRDRSAELQFEYFNVGDLHASNRRRSSRDSAMSVPRGAASPLPPALATPDLLVRTPDGLSPSTHPAHAPRLPELAHSWLPDFSHHAITLEPIMDVRSEENSAESSVAGGAGGGSHGDVPLTDSPGEMDPTRGPPSPTASITSLRRTSLSFLSRPQRAPGGPRRLPSNASVRSSTSATKGPHDSA